MTLFIYITESNPRIEYLFNYVFNDYLQLDTEIIISKNAQFNPDDFIVSYGKHHSSSKIHFEAHNLLFENEIKPQQIDVFEHNQHPVLFKVDNGILPFDPFAMIFYLLSRYEEYLPFDADAHGRFPAKASLAFKHNFLKLPLVEILIHEIYNLLLANGFKAQPITYEFEPLITFDVDQPFKYRGKGWLRNIGGGFKALFSDQPTEGLRRLGYMLFGGKDPFNNFNYLIETLNDFELQAIFFLLLENEGEHNPMIHPKHYAYEILVDKLIRFADIGIHPSYHANDNNQLQKEIARFETLTEHQPIKSKQHFLRMQLPDTYRLLVEHGISNDYTMAYAELPGFRASTSRPFPFYDLSAEKEQPLTIHPFAFMDATFEYYLKNTSENEVLTSFFELADNLKPVKGVLGVTLHNDIISNSSTNKNWQQIIERIFSYFFEYKSN